MDDRPDHPGLDDDTGAGAPICGACGVTALPSETADGFVCEHPDCPAYGEPV